jgi:hypothetical protein
MESRPLVNGELYDPLIANNFGRNLELKHRNKLLLLLATLVGLREIELTLATIGLFVAPTGELNEFVILPESITRGGQERPVLITHVEVKKALEQYLKWLLDNNINSLPHKHYLGLDPNAPLLVDDNYKVFTMQSRGESISPNAMNKCIDKLIKNTKLWTQGVRRLSLVRTYVIEAKKAGMSTNDIMITSGFSEDSISKILIMDYSEYSPIFEWFTKRETQKSQRTAAFKRRRERFMK